MKVGKQGGAQMLLHLGYEKILGDAVGSKKKKPLMSHMLVLFRLASMCRSVRLERWRGLFAY